MAYGNYHIFDIIIFKIKLNTDENIIKIYKFSKMLNYF